MKTKKYFHINPINKLSPPKIMLLGFGLIILIGSILLMFPISSKDGTATNFIDCLFTATSTVCVTGLVVVDTSLHWSIFGKIVIILLIQIGGIGFMSISSLIAVMLGKKINLRHRLLIQESFNQSELSGAVRLILHVMKYTFTIESIGALLLMTVFIPEFGILKGFSYGIFHSISAFCNAGFDLMGSTSGEYASLIKYYNNPIIVFTITSLIISGGLGFTVLVNIKQYYKIKKLSLHTKLVLITTIILIISGTVLIFCGEYKNPETLGNKSLFEKFELAYFQSVTTRTAGYATIEINKMRESTLFIAIMLMFIGASPSSTGGGIKTTTLAVLYLTFRSFMRNDKEVVAFKRRLNTSCLRKALCIFFIAVFTVFTGSYLLTITQNKNFDLLSSVFEASSAYATVGLSLAGSNNLNTIGKFIIICLMYTGRVGSLTILTLLFTDNKEKNIRYPEEKISIG